MLKLFRILSLSVFVVFFLQGCLMSTKTYTPKPFEIAKVKKDRALIYFYRPESIISKHNHWRFLLNETQIVRPLIDKGYIPAHVKPGTVKIAMKQDVYPYNTYDELILNVQKGKTYYIKASPGAFDFSTMQVINEAQGLQEIRSAVFHVEDK